MICCYFNELQCLFRNDPNLDSPEVSSFNSVDKRTAPVPDEQLQEEGNQIGVPLDHSDLMKPKIPKLKSIKI